MAAAGACLLGGAHAEPGGDGELRPGPDPLQGVGDGVIGRERAASRARQHDVIDKAAGPAQHGVQPGRGRRRCRHPDDVDAMHARLPADLASVIRRQVHDDQSVHARPGRVGHEGRDVVSQ
ncbi:hypothetical protein G6F68_016942 [Rhizopus microsporus]|nr:hypothetical protein G6F68_016942 [Rhizopus microsporus]